MRIAVSGTASIGKTTFVHDFINTWQSFTSPIYSYRSLVKDGIHSEQSTKERQWAILNSMCDEMQKFGKDENVIFDRSPIDNIVYTLWLYEKGLGDIDDKFVGQCIPIAREIVRLLDIQFFIPITAAAPMKIDDTKDGARNTDETYIKEIDALFKAVGQQHASGEECALFVRDDKPAWIEIFGNPHQRIEMARLYVAADGSAIGESGLLSTLGDSPEIEQLKEALGVQDEQSAIYNRVKNG